MLYFSSDRMNNKYVWKRVEVTIERKSNNAGKRNDREAVDKVNTKGNKTLGRARDPRANSAWLSKRTERNMKCLS